MSLQKLLTTHINKALREFYNTSIDVIDFQATRKDFEGDITVVTFSMLRKIKTNPQEIGEKLGAYLTKNLPEVVGYNVVKGFLNLCFSDAYFMQVFKNINATESYGFKAPKSTKTTMIEYSSPNTNKPLHLGHIRNNLLGYSVAEIIKASGKKVYKTQIINDRGIHICKSMLAWQRYGLGDTPTSTGLKGDKLVGSYYVRFDAEYKKEIAQLVTDGFTEAEAKSQAPILLAAQKLLRKWESGDKEVVELWAKMNQWVYDGFEETYKDLGVDFDHLYYESQTYLLGKSFIEEGLKSSVFYKKEDGSVWCDLTSDGLDEKIVLRSDGTAVYMTQDIGTAIQRLQDYPEVDSLIYTVGNEQDYHFKVLFLILKKLGFEWAKELYHLSYGMVDLPSGKMKSREGTVVDADDLIAEMTATAKEISKDLGKLEGYSASEKEETYKIIGLGALKYFILKVDPKKRILFDPKASVDFQGNTGPFIQYTYARIQAILRKYTTSEVVNQSLVNIQFHSKEKQLIKQLELYPQAIQQAADQHSPAIIANYVYDLVKDFNSFYQNVSILGSANLSEKYFRVQLSKTVGDIIKSALGLLGINVPQRM